MLLGSPAARGKLRKVPLVHDSDIDIKLYSMHISSLTTLIIPTSGSIRKAILVDEGQPQPQPPMRPCSDPLSGQIYREPTGQKSIMNAGVIVGGALQAVPISASWLEQHLSTRPPFPLSPSPPLLHFNLASLASPLHHDLIHPVFRNQRRDESSISLFFAHFCISKTSLTI